MIVTHKCTKIPLFCKITKIFFQTQKSVFSLWKIHFPRIDLAILDSQNVTLLLLLEKNLNDELDKLQ